MDRIESFRQSLDRALRHHLPFARSDSREISEDNVQVSAFDQHWSSTATGFDLESGVAGQAFTTAFMVVVSSRSHSAVFADGHHLYTFTNGASSRDFVSQRALPSQRDAVREFGSILVNGVNQDATTRKKEEDFLNKDRKRK